MIAANILKKRKVERFVVLYTAPVEIKQRREGSESKFREGKVES